MTIIVLMFSIHAAAQENTGGKLKKIVQGTVDFIGYVLNDVDTTYIEKNRYNMTFMPEYSYSYEHYSFGTEPMCSPQNIDSLNNTFHGKEAKPTVPYQLSSLRFQNNL